ncbi:MAG TPA: UDP-N-acetylmuramoyl-L-alanine--D-glutamate ligase [Tepidisphaeraceae bacterium]|jgi:UDP-N-acetylmuramoylalanine--D-glutamate ligase
MNDVNRKKVTVLGLGRFGGGIAVARWLCEQGAIVTVTDRDDASKLAASVDQLAGLPITFRLGESRPEDFTQADLVVTSPAVKPTHDMLLAAAAAGVPVTTEICLFAERCPGRVFGVTGTKGKSTTSKLLGLMLGDEAFLGGNIGKSLLADLPRMTERSLIVLELSSYMLHWLGLMHWSPNVAVLTMLGLDHVEWHGDAEAYMNAKRNIVRFQRPGDTLVRRDDALSQTFQPTAGVVTHIYPTHAVQSFALKLPGAHNQANAQAAFLAAQTAGISFETAQARVAEFGGLPHRLQLVHEADGVRYFNDSIATIPEAAVIACDAFPAGRVIQIVGGSMKEGLSWDAMCDHLAVRCKKVLTIGQIGQALAGRSGGEYVETLDRAVARAKQFATPGDVVLLSPGTASYGQFNNFEERGEQFAQLVRS